MTNRSRYKPAAEVIEEIERLRGWSDDAFRRYVKLRERVKQLNLAVKRSVIGARRLQPSWPV
jgi:hypothetical protein